MEKNIYRFLLDNWEYLKGSTFTYRLLTDIVDMVDLKITGQKHPRADAYLYRSSKSCLKSGYNNNLEA